MDIKLGNIKNDTGENYLAPWLVFGVNPDKNEGFNGSELANGRMAARRLYWGSTDRQKAMNFTKPSSRRERGISYDNFEPLFRKFFDCYQPGR